jgi:nucleotide-binding universal stress UspA family protein
MIISSPSGAVKCPRIEREGEMRIEIRKILVPTDFSDSARYALDYAISLSKEFGAEVTLVHVVEPMAVGYTSDLFPVPMAEVFQEISGYARKALAGLAAAVTEEGAAVRESLLQGKPAHEIVAAAREGSFDMIVMGTHGRGVLDHALFGSTTERVVRQAPCPVLTCRKPVHDQRKP